MSLVIRACDGFDELSACVQLQIDVWGYGDRDVVPRRVFVVSQRIGGQVMGAFDGPEGSLIGFAMALPGIKDGQPYLHSHMLAVNPHFRNQGIGRRLKLFQREEALGRKIYRMQWTFDPLEVKNSYLNIVKLGAIVQSYAPNFYGVSSSRLQGEIPTDRLYAEWWLESERVCSTLAGQTLAVPTVEQEIFVPHQVSQWRYTPADRALVLELQTRNREQFQQAFARKRAVVGFRIDAERNGFFQLGPWQGPTRSSAAIPT